MIRSVFVLLFGLSFVHCDTFGDPHSYARRIESPNEFIGGPSALASVGDYIIGNEHVRFIIQDKGWSRGFGIFGGSIIDADVVRPGDRGTPNGGNGNDYFGELFPALFLEAFDVKDTTFKDDRGKIIEVSGIEIINDGSNGEAAIIRTRAEGGDFLAMMTEILDFLNPSEGIRFETDYVLHPDARHVEIIGRVYNFTANTIELPDSGAESLFQTIGSSAQVDDIQLPIGDVLLFGAGNKVFAPGAVDRQGGGVKNIGFDLRFALEESYNIPTLLPALPGLVVDFLASAGDGVSYGVALADSPRNFSWINRNQYANNSQANVTQHSMVVPLLISSFAGAFYESAPDVLAPFGQDGWKFEYKRYFIVGNGDVGTIRDELYRIRGTETGSFEGIVNNQLTGAPEPDAWIHVLDEQKRPYSQIQTNAQGRFAANLAPGVYYTKVTAPGRYPWPNLSDGTIDEAALEATAFEIRLGSGTCTVSGKRNCAPSVYRHISLPAPAYIGAQVRDQDGRAIPAKVSVVGRYDSVYDGQNPQDFLFDFSLGEERRRTDLTWRDEPAARQRQYIQAVFNTDNGFAAGVLPPTPCNDDPRLISQGVEVECYAYDIYVSRGPEYDIHIERNVIIPPGESFFFDATLPRTVDTRDYVAADTHLHAINSADSAFAMEERVIAVAAEGVELAVSTDHNFVTDYLPWVASRNLQDWMTSIVGVELSTLEMGHFNMFPVRYDLSTTTHFPLVEVCSSAAKSNGSAFDWVECKPQELFDNARALGTYGPQTIVQVNHPRDTILGYFNQYSVNPYTAEPETADPANNPAAGVFIYPHSRVKDQYAPESFSWDFEVMEVLNGKRMDLRRAFELPTDAPQAVVDKLQDFNCGSGHPQNGPGKPVLRSGGHVAYPGAVDDWFNMLNAGRRKTAVGVSDSHDGHEEPGYARTYVYVKPEDNTGKRRDDDPSDLSEQEIIESLRNGQAIVSNAPFLDIAVITDNADPDPGSPSILTWTMGETVRFGSDNSGREVDVLITLKSAPWVRVDRIVVYANGEPVGDPIMVPQQELGDGQWVDDDNTFRRSFVFNEDVVLVAEAFSDQNLFPVVTPREQPPANISLALEGFVGALGLEDVFVPNDGVQAPDFVQKVTPYALTNPIWLDIDASGQFDPPGTSTGPGAAPPKDPGAICPQDLVARDFGKRIYNLFRAPRTGGMHYNVADIRKIFHGNYH